MQRIFGFIIKRIFAPLIALIIIVVIATFFIENWLFLAGQRYHEVKPRSNNANGLIETLYINVKDINVNNGSMLFDIWAEASDALTDTELITMTVTFAREIIVTNGTNDQASENICPQFQPFTDAVDTGAIKDTGGMTSLQAILQRTEHGTYETIRSEPSGKGNTQSLEMETGREKLWYPFDRYHIQFYICLESKDGELLARKTFFKLTDPELVYYYPYLNSLVNTDGIPLYNSVDVTIGRALYFLGITIIFLVLGLVITLWTLWRAIKQRHEPDESPFEVLGLNLGIILAIPDIHDLLIVPEELAYAPVIDLMSLAIVGASVLSIIFYVGGRMSPMPEMEGKTLKETIEELKKKRDLGNQWEERIWFFHNGEGEISIPANEQEHYRVITTDPPAKEPIGNRKIKIEVCKRPTMPDLQGKKLSEAISTLQEAGIRHYKMFCSDQPFTINPEYYDFCRVQRTDPAKDTTVGVSKVVTIHVSFGFENMW
jgi:hypothetical protein